MPLLATYCTSIMRAAVWWMLLSCSILAMLLQNIPLCHHRGWAVRFLNYLCECSPFSTD